VGGSKVSSKIGVIESLLEKVDILLLGGGMIFTFYKAQGLAVGSSLVEEDKLELATTLIAKAKAKGVSLLLPSDVVIADKFAPDANSQVCFLSYFSLATDIITMHFYLFIVVCCKNLNSALTLSDSASICYP